VKSYAITPHTADVRLFVKAPSLEKLFAHALEGMNRILNKEYERSLNKHTLVREITIAACDPTSLLIDFLSEVLTLSHINKAIFYTVDRLELEGNALHAHIVGAKVDMFMEDIKAVTYHEADVRQNDKGEYGTTIVFDI